MAFEKWLLWMASVEFFFFYGGNLKMKMICSKMIQHSTQKENLFTRIVFFSYHLRAQFSLSFCFAEKRDGYKPQKVFPLILLDCME